MVGYIVMLTLFLLPVGLWLLGVILFGSLKIALGVLFCVFVVIPVVFKYTYPLQRSMIFLNFVSWPRNPDFKNPSTYGLDATRNFYVTTEEGITLGVWHILPRSLTSEMKEYNKSSFESTLTSGHPIILYMHGNSGSRASSHRVELYKILRNMNYHVICFDYRSYADSSPVLPTELGVVSDGLYMFKWLEQRVGNSPIFVWGHSLGTGVSSHVLSVLYKEGHQAAGLILESPFNNLADEMRHHAFSKPFVYLPWFDYFFTAPVGANGLRFESDQHLINVACPVLILHAQDDVVVPFILGLTLYKGLLQSRSTEAGNVEFVVFEEKFKYGHKYICRAPDLPSIIQRFVGNNT